MSQFQPRLTTDIENAPIVAGQLIIDTVNKTIYFDQTNSLRLALYEDMADSALETYSDSSLFPAVGSNETLYVDTTANKVYRYDTTNSEYISITDTTELTNVYTKEEIDLKLDNIIALMESI